MNFLRLLALTAILSIGQGNRATAAQDSTGPGVLPPPGASAAPTTTPPLVVPSPPQEDSTPPPATPAPPNPAVAPPPAYASPAYGGLESLLPPVVETLPAEPATSVSDDSLSATIAPITPTPHWYHPNYWFGEDPRTAGVELGINGSEGNNDTFSMRSGGHLKRETSLWKFDSSLVYNRNNANSIETQNNGKLDARLDRNIAESHWTLFALENMIYDEFQSYDIQLSLNSGVGYRWIKTETIDFLTRVGAGTTREFGSTDEEWKPTALFGVDYEHQISKMQRLVGRVDYFPEWEEFRNYRVVTDLGWQIDLDRPKNLSLKLSVIDRYDSTPEGKRPNNLDYAVLLIWGL
jgi:putative salt-induced outer membrane protein YdiY